MIGIMAQQICYDRKHCSHNDKACCKTRKIAEMLFLACFFRSCCCGSLLDLLCGFGNKAVIDIADCFTHLLAMVGLQISEGAVSLVPFIDDATIYTAKQYALFYPVVVFCALPILPWIKAKIEKSSILSKLCDVGTTVALTALLALSVITLVGQTYNPFIYFRF